MKEVNRGAKGKEKGEKRGGKEKKAACAVSKIHSKNTRTHSHTVKKHHQLKLASLINLCGNNNPNRGICNNEY